MTKPLKPGQLCMINDQLYRAIKRKGICTNCCFDFRTCPNAVIANEYRKPKVDCDTNWVAFVEVKLEQNEEKTEKYT